MCGRTDTINKTNDDHLSPLGLVGQKDKDILDPHKSGMN